MKRDTAGYLKPLDFKRGCIEMNHGAGGRVGAQLVEQLFARAFDNHFLRQGNDGASLPALPAGHRLVMATDAHVISPLFFPGGDIGSLAVHGTVNDVAMLGATPLYLSASFILEEGLPLQQLQRIVLSMAAASRAAGVPVVTGDTKVVERGKGDGVFISTTGVGALPAARDIGGANARPGDVVLLSGTIGEHGVAVLSQRESLQFGTAIESDSAALHTLVAALLAAVPEGAVRVLRDPTRGGAGDHVERDRGPVRRRPAAGRSLHSDVAAGGRRLRAAGAGPAVHRQRGQAGGHRRARGGRRRAGSPALPPAGRACCAHRRGTR